MTQKESFDDLMSRQQSLQHLDDPDGLLKRLNLMEKAHKVSIRYALFWTVFATIVFLGTGYIFLTVRQPSIKNQVALFIAVAAFLFSIRLLLQGYALLKKVRELKDEIARSAKIEKNGS